MAFQPLDEESITEVSIIFKALSDPTRIRILHLLYQYECPVNEIAERLNLQQSAVSHQLKYLRQLKLVRNRREKTMYYYTADDEHVRNLLEQTILHAMHT